MNEGKRGYKVIKHVASPKKPAPKPRNFVAKNATTSGAGAHKDKKKAMKQGDTKHKKAEMAEGYYNDYDNNRTGFRKARPDVSGEGEPQGMFTVVVDGRPWKEFTSNKAFSVAKTLANKHPNKKIQVRWPSGELNTVAENIMKEDIMGAPPPESNHEATMALSELYRNAKYGMALLKIIEDNDAIDGWVQANLTSAASMLDKVYHYLDYKNINGRKPDMEDIEEDDNVDDSEQGESDGSMARENLAMIVEYSIKLMEMIKPGDNLASWVSMKLTKASEAVSSSKHFIEYRQFEKHNDDMFENKLTRMLAKQLSEILK